MHTLIIIYIDYPILLFSSKFKSTASKALVIPCLETKLFHRTLLTWSQLCRLSFFFAFPSPGWNSLSVVSICHVHVSEILSSTTHKLIILLALLPDLKRCHCEFLASAPALSFLSPLCQSSCHHLVYLTALSPTWQSKRIVLHRYMVTLQRLRCSIAFHFPVWRPYIHFCTISFQFVLLGVDVRYISLLSQCYCYLLLKFTQSQSESTWIWNSHFQELPNCFTLGSWGRTVQKYSVHVSTMNELHTELRCSGYDLVKSSFNSKTRWYMLLHYFTVTNIR